MIIHIWCVVNIIQWKDSLAVIGDKISGGKRTFNEEFGNDGITDAQLNEIGNLIESPEVSDQEMIETGEEMERETSPLFHFEFEPVGRSKKALDTVKKQRGTAQKRQLREATKKDDIGKEITCGVADMARRVLESSKAPNGRDLHPNDRVMFNFTTKKFSHPLQLAKFSVEEIVEDTSHWDTYLLMLTNQLNSNESLDATDDFQVDMTIIAEPDASGKTALNILGKLNMATVLQRKKYVLAIKNEEDNLCLARANCLTKAWCRPCDTRIVKDDYEAMLDEDGTRTPILIVAQTSKSDDVMEFYGPECTGDFLAFLDELAYGPPEENHHYSDFREVIGIFHNLKGYDSVFLQEQMVKEGPRFEFLIPNRTKNLCMKVGKISFKDSMCFLPMSLASFSSTFGIPELKKGFFPHKFHTPDHQNYIGPLPAPEYYDPNGMSAKKKQEFEEWYAGERSKNLPFNLKEELISYCRSDVALLKAGCLKFIAEFKAIAKFDPIEKCITIAQACNRYWRNCVMAPDSIAIEPENGWEGATPNHSHVALELLMWCQWEQKKKSDPVLRGFTQTLQITSPLQPREAFFGGRTGARTLYHHIDSTQGEQIRYRDVTSEYTWVNKYGEYPIGHPTIILQPANQDPHAYYGLMKVSILPPTHLFNPVLPHQQKIGSTSKLTFPLCRSCVTEESLKPLPERNFVCTHSDKERMLIGTWCTHEILKAIQMGYQLICIHEVWHFEKRQLGLFAPYAGTWLKVKQESSGYLAWCQTEEQKAHYVSQYKEKEDCVLYYDTDSVLYRWRPGESEIPLGDYLGDMTNELDADDYIMEFISAGAKNYGYVTHQGKCCVKVKGFSLNVRGMQQLNYDVMKVNIIDEIQHPLDEARKTEIINSIHFMRDPVKKKIRTETQFKSYRLVFDKRVMQLGRFRSYPYGFDRMDDEDQELIDLLMC
ncbi:putative DNA polymerase [Stylophora pistillata]|uniref:DNA-directed DNA polymerase n=1 Tax=Stylophora pistillata TaxID=50429 RepID=A0A2B4R8G8_STYPI|nr:putative DNA polymerase [Stylophora pistillata]